MKNEWDALERELDLLDTETRMSGEYAVIATVVLLCAGGIFLLSIWLNG